MTKRAHDKLWQQIRDYALNPDYSSTYRCGDGVAWGLGAIFRDDIAQSENGRLILNLRIRGYRHPKETL